MDKAEVARRQLGTALDMFLRGQDPVSVHCLAVGGGEIAERLAEKGAGEPFKNHAMKTFPDLGAGEIKRLRNRVWNAFKHATGHKGADRDDAAILEGFSPVENEHALFIGWYDFGMAGLSRPVEAQIFELWYMAKYPEKLDTAADTSSIKLAFPDLTTLSPSRQHARLEERIRKTRKNGAVMQAEGTDRRPLVLRWA